MHLHRVRALCYISSDSNKVLQIAVPPITARTMARVRVERLKRMMEVYIATDVRMVVSLAE